MDFIKNLFADNVFMAILNVGSIAVGPYTLTVSDSRTSYKIDGIRGSSDSVSTITSAIKTRLDALGVGYVTSGDAFSFTGFTEMSGTGVVSKKVNLNDSLFRQNNLLMVATGAVVARVL